MTDVLWDIANSLGATLSLGDTKATMDNNVGAGQGGVRATVGWSTGKRYFEVGVVLNDGISVGLTTTNAHNFPGKLVRGISRDSSGYYNDGAHNSGGGPGLGGGTRVGVKVDFDNNVVEFISLDHVEGVDTLGYTFAGDTAYPSIGTGYGNGASHPCSAIIYGNEADFTLPHDASYVAWGVTAPPYTPLDPVQALANRYDARLVGGRYISPMYPLSSGAQARAAVSVPSRKRVVVADLDGLLTVEVESAELDGEPGAVSTDLAQSVTQAILVPTNTGMLYRLDGITLAATTSRDVGCSNPTWCSQHGTVGVCQGPGNSILAVDLTTLTELGRADHVLDELDAAVAINGYVVAFGGGKSAVLRLSSAGVLTKLDELWVPSGGPTFKNVVRVLTNAAGDAVYVAEIDRIYRLALATAGGESHWVLEACVTATDADGVRSLIGDPLTLIGVEKDALLSALFNWWWAADDACVVGPSDVAILHGRSGRITIDSLSPG